MLFCYLIEYQLLKFQSNVSAHIMIVRFILQNFHASINKDMSFAFFKNSITKNFFRSTILNISIRTRQKKHKLCFHFFYLKLFKISEFRFQNIEKQKQCKHILKKKSNIQCQKYDRMII